MLAEMISRVNGVVFGVLGVMLVYVAFHGAVPRAYPVIQCGDLMAAAAFIYLAMCGLFRPTDSK